jgi:hypothetical protein
MCKQAIGKTVAKPGNQSHKNVLNIKSCSSAGRYYPKGMLNIRRLIFEGLTGPGRSVYNFARLKAER